MAKPVPLATLIFDVLEQGAAWWEAREDLGVGGARVEYERQREVLVGCLERLIRRLGGR